LWSVDGGRELVCRLTEETMKAVGSSELGLLPAEGDDEENGFVLASSWGENGKGELRWLLVKEGLLLAGEGRRRCWNRLEREKENEGLCRKGTPAGRGKPKTWGGGSLQQGKGGFG
jgi:hypothetical protein